MKEQTKVFENFKLNSNREDRQMLIIIQIYQGTWELNKKIHSLFNSNQIIVEYYLYGESLKYEFKFPLKLVYLN